MRFPALPWNSVRLECACPVCGSVGRVRLWRGLITRTRHRQAFLGKPCPGHRAPAETQLYALRNASPTPAQAPTEKRP